MIKFISRKELIDRIEKLENKISLLETKLEGIQKYNEEVIGNINNIFFDVNMSKEEKDKKEQADKKQENVFSEIAGVFDWGD